MLTNMLQRNRFQKTSASHKKQIYVIGKTLSVCLSYNLNNYDHNKLGVGPGTKSPTKVRLTVRSLYADCIVSEVHPEITRNNPSKIKKHAYGLSRPCPHDNPLPIIFSLAATLWMPWSMLRCTHSLGRRWAESKHLRASRGHLGRGAPVRGADRAGIVRCRSNCSAVPAYGSSRSGAWGARGA